MNKKILALALALSLGGALMLVSSCSKHDDSLGTATNSGTQNERTVQRIKQMLSKVPASKIIHEMKRLNNASTNHTLDFSFANSGNNGFTNNSTTTFTNLATNAYTAISYTVYMAYNSFGAGLGGGTVVAGPTSLDMNYTFCFSASDAAFGLDLLNTGAPTNGISAVIGVSGDFSQLQNATDSTNLGDVFKGLAFYLVYDDRPSGSYDVIDFSDVTWTDSTSINNKCFAFIFDLQNGRFFVSKSGNINVSGGSMAYNGDYYEISGFLNDNGDFDITSPSANLTLSVVPGFGTMGCN